MTLRPFANTRPVLADGVYVDETALIIGDVVVGENSSIWPYAVVRGDVSHIRTVPEPISRTTAWYTYRTTAATDREVSPL